MALPKWTVTNNYDFGTIQERTITSIPLPLETTDGVTTQLIGKFPLPNGLRVENNSIIGTPQNVSKETVFKFVIRASTVDGIADRTFSMTIAGADEPVWQTDEGLLPIGPNGVYFILDSSPIDFQLVAEDEDIPAGQQLEYFIADGDGELPPGITLTPDGKIQGVVDPLRALDVNEIILGYDAGAYSANVFDWGADSDDPIESLYYGTVTFTGIDLVRPPKKLNRRYEFYVSVADDATIKKRRFEIYVISDEFTRADNTIMEADTNVFTADLTYLRTPIWITPSDLGIRRANNYTTVFLDVLKQPDVTGAVKYIFKQTNPGQYRLKATGEISRGFYELSGQLPNFPKSNRGPLSINNAFQADPIRPDEFETVVPETPSVLPPGLTLDPDSGELAGNVPYQPAVTRDFQFTVGAFRYDEDTGLVTVFATYYEDTLAGTRIIKVAKLPTGQQDQIDDLIDLIDQEVEIEGRRYFIEGVDDRNTDYDLVILDKPLEPSYAIDPLTLVEQANSGQDYFFINQLSEDYRATYKGKDINFTETESVKITEIFPYIRYSIKANTGRYVELRTDIVPFNTDVQTSLEAYLFNTTKRSAYVQTITDGVGITEIIIDVSITSTTSNRTFFSNLFHTDDSTTVGVTNVTVFDRVKLGTNLQRTLADGRTVRFGLFRGGFFNKTFSVIEKDLIESLKTFNIKILGEVESTITWLSPDVLGTIKTNRISNFAVKATTTLPNTSVKYSLIGGTLPYGMSLKENGEIVGRVPNTGTIENPGVTKIDNNATTFDGNTSGFDREFEFTILARDRLAYSAVSKTFKIILDASDVLNYSTLYMKPFLKTDQRRIFSDLMNNVEVFDPKSIYRPGDPEYGVQKELKSLVFAGLETKEIDDYVSAVAQNHKRKKYNFGKIKTAEAKLPGTNDVVYEVVYIELVDPAKPTSGKTKKSFVQPSKSAKKITVDSIELEPNDDQFGGGIGGVFFNILKKDNTIFELNVEDNRLLVQKFDGTFVSLLFLNTFPVLTKSGNLIQIQPAVVTTNETVEEWRRFRPTNTTLKADNSAFSVSENQDNKHYISNIDNMRDNLEQIGEKSKEFLPLWMQTAQLPELQELGYVFAVPLAYTKPGNSESIKIALEQYIKTNDFDFKKIDYDIDRYIIDATIGNNDEQYIFFANYVYNV